MIKLSGLDQSTDLDIREGYIKNIKFPEKYVYLQTCDRVELYEGDGVVPKEILSHLSYVASGVRSSIIGETQIQGQVKRAYSRAVSHKHISSSLHYLFQNALKIGKKVRTATSIGHGAVGYGKGVIELISMFYPELSKINVLVLGVNNINEDIVRFLTEHDNRTVFIGNRTYEKAIKVAGLLGGEAFTLRDSEKILPEMDVVISCTSAPHLIFGLKHFEKIKRKQLVVDLAVPRDIDPCISGLANKKLFNIVDVESRISSNYKDRKEQVEKAKTIIERATDIAYEKQFKSCYA